MNKIPFIYVLRKFSYWVSILKYIMVFNELSSTKCYSVMLVCHDVNRSFLWDGKRYAHLLDSINDRLTAVGIDTISVSKPFSKKSLKNYCDPVNINGLMVRAILIDKLFRILSIKHKSCNFTTRAWATVLDKISPKIIIGIQPSAELCMAAKLKKIWIADLQHGIISGEEYYGVDYRSEYQQSGWPSCILCWNQASLKWIEDNINCYTKGLIVGNPWVLRFSNILEGDDLALTASKFNFPPKAGRLTILLTLQWGALLEKYPPVGLPNGLMSFIKHSENNYDWWIRVHPVMLNNLGREKSFSLLEREFGNVSNIHWLHSTDMPLPKIFSQVDLHLTLSSAATVEAAWFGIPTGLLEENTSNLMNWLRSEINSGFAEIIKPDCENILNWIDRNAFSIKKNFLFPERSDLLDALIFNINYCIINPNEIEDRLTKI